MLKQPHPEVGGTWLVSSAILRGRWQTQVFWVMAAASSTLEPSGQTGWVMERSLPMFLALYSSGFAFNLTQAHFFREYGFLAALSVRLGDYLIWHIIYGNLICNCCGPAGYHTPRCTPLR